jgi:hypothetical protein
LFFFLKFSRNGCSYFTCKSFDFWNPKSLHRKRLFIFLIQKIWFHSKKAIFFFCTRMLVFWKYFFNSYLFLREWKLWNSCHFLR